MFEGNNFANYSVHAVSGVSNWEYCWIACIVSVTDNSCSAVAVLVLSGCECRSQWPRGLRRKSAAARLLRLWVRIPLEAWKFVSCECCMLTGRSLCDELITRPEEFYRLWRVVECDLETSIMSWPCPTGGCCAKRKKERKKVAATTYQK